MTTATEPRCFYCDSSDVLDDVTLVRLCHLCAKAWGRGYGLVHVPPPDWAQPRAYVLFQDVADSHVTLAAALNTFGVSDEARTAGIAYLDRWVSGKEQTNRARDL